jgi:hypothetical protein
MAKRQERQKTIGELEDEVRRLQDEVRGLRKALEEDQHTNDGLRDLTDRFRENADDYVNCLEAWKETFGMVMTESGGWTWAPFWDERSKIIDAYNNLAQRWNKYLPLINGQSRNVGRPLAASEAQVDTVRKLRKAGRSLRGIAEDTSLGLDTVRTIVGQMHLKDRTTNKHRQRIERIDLREEMASWKRQRRSGGALPKRVQGVIEAANELVTEARGLASHSRGAGEVRAGGAEAARSGHPARPERQP